MSANKNIVADAPMKKSKGLKNHKKAQKEKTKAKRIAAAEKSKAPAVAVAKEDMSLEDTTSMAIDVTVTDEAPTKESTTDDDLTFKGPTMDEIDIHSTTTTNSSSVSEDNMVSYDTDVTAQESATPISQVEAAPERIITNTEKLAIYHGMSPHNLDVQAHCKALEAALYDNMETPKQMLVRLTSKTTADTEYHLNDEYDEPIALLNEFENSPVATDMTDDTPTVGSSLSVEQLFSAVSSTGASVVGTSKPSASRTLESIELQQNETPVSQSLSIDELFSRVANTGVSVVGTTKPTAASRTLESVEMQQSINITAEEGNQSRPITIEQLFSAASGTIVSANTADKATAGQTLESIEADMRATKSKDLADTIACIDPAIISCRLKKTAKKLNVGDITTAPHDQDQDAASEKLKCLLGIASSKDTSSTTTSQHSRASSPLEEGFYTPATHYSVSPPPVALGSFGSSYPVWSDNLAGPNFLDPDVSCFYPQDGAAWDHFAGVDPLVAQQYAQMEQWNMANQTYYGYSWQPAIGYAQC